MLSRNQVKAPCGSFGTSRYLRSLMNPGSERPDCRTTGIICLLSDVAIPISCGTHSDSFELTLHSRRKRSHCLIAVMIAGERGVPGGTSYSATKTSTGADARSD